MTENLLYRFVHFYPEIMMEADKVHTPNNMYNQFSFYIDPIYDN